jgi:hypothetical protein
MALMTSLSPHANKFSEKAIQTFPACVFGYRSGQMGTANHKKKRIFKTIT